MKSFSNVVWAALLCATMWFFLGWLFGASIAVGVWSYRGVLSMLGG